MLTLILPAFHCDKRIVDLRYEQAVLRNGVSFGECLGYCSRELEITASEMRFTQTGWNLEGSLPPVVRTRETAAEEWNALVSLIDMGNIKSLDTRYGCPDCMDQGAEWIEIIQGDYRKKVTFEYNRPLPKVQKLLDKLREYRTGFED